MIVQLEVNENTFIQSNTSLSLSFSLLSLLYHGISSLVLIQELQEHLWHPVALLIPLLLPRLIQ